MVHLVGLAVSNKIVYFKQSHSIKHSKLKYDNIDSKGKGSHNNNLRFEVEAL